MSWRTLAIGALVLAIVIVAWMRWPEEVRDDVPAAAPSPRSRSLAVGPRWGPGAIIEPPLGASLPPRPSSCLEQKGWDDLVAALRTYLDMDSESPAGHRLELLVTMKALREPGCDVLGEVPTLVRLLYEARPFGTSPTELSGAGVLERMTWTGSLDAGALRFRFQPDSSPPRPTRFQNSVRPSPLIVMLHDAEDVALVEDERHLGAEVILRRYPRATSKAIYDDFLLYAPVAAPRRFVSDGAIDASNVPLNAVWKNFHVDFDRTVLDGGSEALLFAAAQAVFYAGMIVRGDAADVDPAVVKNFAHLPVYVVGTDASAAKKSLLAGRMSMENITVGKEDGIHAWVKGLERTTPKHFEWIVKDKSAQRFAHWININEIDPAVGEPTMKVEVLDTPNDPNTVRITSQGVRGLSLFLNDRILDLDKPVRVVLNGKPVADAKLMTGVPAAKRVTLPATLDRSVDVAFDASPDLSVRRSRYYGFIYPVVLDFPVRSDTEMGARMAARSVAGAMPQQEADAAQYFAKAAEVEQAGELEKAKRLFRKAADVGDTTIKRKAEERLKALQNR